MGGSPGSVHLFLISTPALDQAPALEIPFPGQARPPSHPAPSPLGPEPRHMSGSSPEIQAGMSLYLSELRVPLVVRIQ